ncbi:hypothetical protein [Hyphomicrobium sp. ghe19]|uniref:hypothetical protein n=1 Tax=Hyphomicrobium sp. ghe19 TaxID=2682968 RepID=UPI0030CC4F4E
MGDGVDMQLPLSSGEMQPLPAMKSSWFTLQIWPNALEMQKLTGRHESTSNQSSEPKTLNEFDDDCRMKPPSHYDRVVDVMEERVKCTPLTLDRAAYRVDRYSDF